MIAKAGKLTPAAVNWLGLRMINNPYWGLIMNNNPYCAVNWLGVRMINNPYFPVNWLGLRVIKNPYCAVNWFGLINNPYWGLRVIITHIVHIADGEREMLMNSPTFTVYCYWTLLFIIGLFIHMHIVRSANIGKLVWGQLLLMESPIHFQGMEINKWQIKR